MAGSNTVLKKYDNAVTGGKKSELLVRVLSSLIFIPPIVALYCASYATFCLLCFGACAVVAFEIFSLKISGKVLLKICGFLVCVLGMVSFVYCRKIFGIHGSIFLVCIASFTDIGAYCAGKALRGPKLCPKVSPNKTWAGFWGGILFANISCYGLEALFLQSSASDEFLSAIVGNFFVVQLVILSSVAGDLLESFFKRCVGVKDMGDLFPGHGGMLDRLDSLILASISLVAISFLL